jgi:hypothetical protein
VPDQIIFVDLSTLIHTPGNKTVPMFQRIAEEEYRQWLIDHIKPLQSVLITARTFIYRAATLENLRLKTEWIPTRAYFAASGMSPRMHKTKVLSSMKISGRLEVLSRIIAIDENKEIRELYRGYGIKAFSYSDPELVRVLNV